jgi:hypothetical protein
LIRASSTLSPFNCNLATKFAAIPFKFLHISISIHSKFSKYLSAKLKVPINISTNIDVANSLVFFPTPIDLRELTDRSLIPLENSSNIRQKFCQFTLACCRFLLHLLIQILLLRSHCLQSFPRVLQLPLAHFYRKKILFNDNFPAIPRSIFEVTQYLRQGQIILIHNSRIFFPFFVPKLCTNFAKFLKIYLRIRNENFQGFHCKIHRISVRNPYS